MDLKIRIAIDGTCKNNLDDSIPSIDLYVIGVMQVISQFMRSIGWRSKGGNVFVKSKNGIATLSVKFDSTFKYITLKNDGDFWWIPVEDMVNIET